MENRIDVATETLGKFQTFRFDCQLVAILIHDLVQILTMQEMNEIPKPATYIEGVIHVRGSFFPAIDLRLRLREIKKAYDDRPCMTCSPFNLRKLGFL